MIMRSSYHPPRESGIDSELGRILQRCNHELSGSCYLLDSRLVHSLGELEGTRKVRKIFSAAPSRTFFDFFFLDGSGPLFLLLSNEPSGYSVMHSITCACSLALHPAWGVLQPSRCVVKVIFTP